MSTKIFDNLPVNDLNRSMAFFQALGDSFNSQFTDEAAASMVISDDIYAMLLTHAKMQDFTPRPIADATKTTEVSVCLPRDTKSDVAFIVEKALAAHVAELLETLLAVGPARVPVGGEYAP